jgi:hypothetical protein
LYHGGGSGIGSVVSVATAHQPQIQHGGDQKPKQIDALHGHALVKHPGINQRGERQKYKAKNEQEKIVMIGGVQVSGKEKQQPEHQPRRQQDKNEEATGHG